MDNIEINALFAERGFRARLVNLERLADVEHEMAVKRRSDVHPTVYDAFLNRFQYMVPSSFPQARSIILIAIPHPITEVSFTWQGKENTVIIPPVYLLTEEAQMIEQFMHESPVLSKFSFSPARVPTKLLAVRSGLAQYGRNNIAYIKGLGSFYSLRAYFTDIKAESDSWQEHEHMETCQECNACLSNCPTGCISDERFLISAERCLTCLNELEGEFPDWVEQSWHNALVGCMECQNICPENANVLANKQFLFTFSEEETRAILESETPLPQHVMEKLNRLGMQHYTNVLGRNLRPLLAKHC